MRGTLAIGCLLVSIALSLASMVNRAQIGPLDFPPLYAAGVAMQQGADPYSEAAICPIERRLQATGPCFSYLDLPPFTPVMLPLSYLTFREASFVWVGLMLACGVLVVFTAAGLIGLWRRRSWLAWVTIIAGALIFFPVKHAIALGQIDSLSALLALLAISTAPMNPIGAGVLATAAIFVKPQTVALSMVALIYKRRRALIGVVLAIAVAAIALVLLQALGHSAGSPLAWYQAIRRTHARLGLPLATLNIALAIAAGVWLWRQRSDRNIGLVELCAIAAAFSVILGPLVYLQTTSVTLLILALLLALAPWVVAAAKPPVLRAIPLGIVCGLLTGDALFSVAYYTGWSHAILPWATTAAFGLGIGLLKPQFWLIVSVALLTNLVATFIPFAPPAQTEFAALAAFGLLVLVLPARKTYAS